MDLFRFGEAGLTEDEASPNAITAMRGAILGVDIGTIYTRTVLFDVVDGMYRFVARGQAPTTAGHPWHDVMEGVLNALQDIMAATGRVLLNEKGELILPEKDSITGVDAFVATSSAGQPIKAVLVGLMPDISVSSGRRAAESTYLELCDVISLGDQRPQHEQVDSILGALPDLILVVGGTDGGAVNSMRHLFDTVILACSMIERNARPVILFAGNTRLQNEAIERFREQAGTQVVVADNVRPDLDVEHLESTQFELAKLYHSQKSRYTNGFAEIGGWTDDGVFPTAHGFSRTVEMISQLYDEDVLGIDLGSTATTVAASLGGRHYLNVFGTLGMGHAAEKVYDQIHPEALARWLTYPTEEPGQVLDYLMNKQAHPTSVPATPFELEIEYAIAREVIRTALAGARATWHRTAQTGPLAKFRTILLSGSTLAAANPGWSMLTALDALQPMGRARILVDPYGVSAVLGGVAQANPLAFVQIMETGAFIDLGTAFTVAGRGRRGEVVARGRVRYSDGTSDNLQARFGQITVVPLRYGELAEVSLRGRDVDTGNEPGRRMRIRGGDVGLVIDARGRPWRVPRDRDQLRALMAEWQKALVGEGSA